MKLFCVLIILCVDKTFPAVPNQRCLTPNNEWAACVPVHRCPVLVKTLYDNKTGAVDFFQQSTCGTDGIHQQLVCCGTKSEKTTDDHPHQQQQSQSTNSNTRTNWLPSRNVCGWQHVDDRFYGKTETAIDEFPWMALLRAEVDGKDRGHVCGATLINRRHLLTAAHCVLPGNLPNMKIVEVRLGEYNLKNEGEDCVDNADYPECTDPAIDVKVEKVIPHPLFKPDYPFSGNDIAIVRMANNVQLSEFIRPICLPRLNETRATVGQILSTSGWASDLKTGKLNPIKRCGKTVVYSSKSCSERASNLKIPKTNMCAVELGNINTTTCQGSSGVSSMFKNDMSQWQQEGILSYHLHGKSGTTTCGPGTITIYTKVSDYVDWIVSQVKP